MTAIIRVAGVRKAQPAAFCFAIRVIPFFFCSIFKPPWFSKLVTFAVKDRNMVNFVYKKGNRMAVPLRVL